MKNYLYKFSRCLLIWSLGFIDLAKYQWFRKRVGGTWYYVAILVDTGMYKHFWWTKTKLPTHYYKVEEYDSN